MKRVPGSGSVRSECFQDPDPEPDPDETFVKIRIRMKIFQTSRFKLVF